MDDEQTTHEQRVQDEAPAVSHVRADQGEARVRRAPKYGVFLGLGAAVGILAALILTFAFDGAMLPNPTTGVSYAPTQVFGFLMLICIAAGVALGGFVALLFDRAFSRRARTVRVDHESVSS